MAVFNLLIIIADYYIRFHFIRFLKLYHNPARDHQAVFLCRQHLSMLCTLAAVARDSENSSSKSRFYRLSVVEFFIREMALEFEATQNFGRMCKLEGSFDGSMDKQDKSSHSLNTRSDSAKSLPSEQSSMTHSGRQLAHGAISPTNRLELPDIFQESPPSQVSEKVESGKCIPKLNLALSDAKKRDSDGVDAKVLLSSPNYSNSSDCRGQDSKISVGRPKSGFKEDFPRMEKPLERIASTAMSIEPGLSVDSCKTGKAERNVTSGRQRANSNKREIIPPGFRFIGDLDEDVDRLEALETVCLILMTILKPLRCDFQVC